MTTNQPQTWHYGLVARYWAEFNDEFRPHEIPYFRRFVEDDGQPALDVACGTGRLLLPYLRAGRDAPRRRRGSLRGREAMGLLAEGGAGVAPRSGQAAA